MKKIRKDLAILAIFGAHPMSNEMLSAEHVP